MRAAAVAVALAACAPSSPNPTPAWEQNIPAAPWASSLVARGDGVCFLVLRGRFDDASQAMRCHGPDGALTWERPLVARQPILAADPAGDVLLGGGNGDDWYIEKRDGATGDVRWRYDFTYSRDSRFPSRPPAQDIPDLVVTASGDIAFTLDGGEGFRDALEPAPVDGFRFLVGLSSDGARRFREVIYDPQMRLAASGDELIALYVTRLERRAPDGAVLSNQPLTFMPFGGTRFVAAADRLYGAAPQPAYLRALTLDGTVAFDVRAGGTGDVRAPEVWGNADGIVVSARFDGNVVLGNTTLQHDSNGAVSSPFDPSGSAASMPLVTVTDLDGHTRWSAALEPLADRHFILGATVLSNRLVLLRQTADDAQLWLSAFDVP